MRHRAAVAVILLLCACADVVLVPVDDPGPSMNISVFATQSVPRACIVSPPTWIPDPIPPPWIQPLSAVPRSW